MSLFLLAGHFEEETHAETSVESAAPVPIDHSTSEQKVEEQVAKDASNQKKNNEAPKNDVKVSKDPSKTAADKSKLERKPSNIVSSLEEWRKKPSGKHAALGPE
jgi:hypothetical protein